jgi:hypothetical protein
VVDRAIEPIDLLFSRGIGAAERVGVFLFGGEGLERVVALFARGLEDGAEVANVPDQSGERLFG